MGAERFLRLTFGFLAACLPSCSLYFDYPQSESEAGAQQCSDLVDNDYNGKTDCEDPSCDGFCPERNELSCKDGRDNDGDGLTDLADPRCWAVESPIVTRCASREWAEFEEHFDGELSTGRWYSFGTIPDTGEAVVQLQPPGERPLRPDSVLGFNTDAPSAGVLGGLASNALVDGNWGAFELGFQARLFEGGLVRVALVPAALAPVGAEPLNSAKDAALMVELDARGTPTVTLQVNDERTSFPWGPNDWHALRLFAKGDDVVLALYGPDSSEALFDAALPMPEMGPSRLVVWGEATPVSGSISPAQIDDLRLVVGAARPCGVASPQIPLGASCRNQPDKLEEDTGFSVAVAGPAREQLCALATAASDHDQPDYAQAWTSHDGGQWVLVGSLSPGGGDPLIGVGVGWDQDAGMFRGILAERSTNTVRLGLVESSDCATWTTPVDPIDLFADAEAPSYLIPGVAAAYEIYFTRPPSPTSERTLWRLRSDDGLVFTLEPQPVAELPGELLATAPLSLSRIGPRDVVATYPVAAGAGGLGLGMAIAMDDDLVVWERVEGWPAVVAEPSGFDNEAIVSGTLWHGTHAAFLLYGGRGQPLNNALLSRSPLTVGTAWLSAADPGASDLPTRPAACGDGQCQAAEGCATCEIDCGVCDGELQFSERFSEGADAWKRVAPADDAAASMYVAEKLHLEPSRAGWTFRDLASPVLSDFELSFDVHVVPPNAEDSESRCAAYVGVGHAPTLWAMDPEGVFARIDQQRVGSGGAVTFSPRVRVGHRSLPTSDEQSDVVTGTAELWHRVSLRRESGTVSMRVTGADGCEIATVGPVAYPGALLQLDTLLVGWDNTFGREGWTTECTDATAAISIDNVVLRSLPCPAAGRSCTDPASGQTFCADFEASPEHCGACFQPVGVAETCNAGKPLCVGELCPAAGGAADACVDLSSSAEHCGVCGNALTEHEECVDGLRTAKKVLMPAGFFIDSTEVTRAQYAEWLSTHPSQADQIAACVGWNVSYQPSCSWPPGDRGNLPVVCVDWCDADAYCRGVGKRLCGKIGGGSADFANWKVTDEAHCQWYNACSSGGQLIYPYGDDYDPLACNGLDYPGAACVATVIGPTCELVEVATAQGCQSPQSDFAGVYDLSGNSVEWVDGCKVDSGPADPCHWLGSATGYPQERLRCDHALVPSSRMKHEPDLGFRCCAL